MSQQEPLDTNYAMSYITRRRVSKRLPHFEKKSITPVYRQGKQFAAIVGEGKGEFFIVA
jgi:hypothetical protein